MKQEQKDALANAGKKIVDTLADDVKKTDIASFKSPIVIAIIALAVVGVVRDPMSLVIGLVIALVMAVAISLSKEDVKQLISSLKKEKPMDAKNSQPSENAESEKK